MADVTSRNSIPRIYRRGILWAIILALLWSCSEGEPPESVSEGPGAPLRLIFKWPGDDLASKQDLELRAKVEQLLVEKQVGKILRSGTGRGWMDVVLEVQDSGRARTEIEAIVKATAPDANYAIQAENLR